MSLLTGIVPSANLERAKRAMASSGVRACDVIRGLPRPTPKANVVRGLLLSRQDLSLDEIAREAHASRSTVHDVYHALLKAGQVPARKRGAQFKPHDAIVALMRADPTRTVKSMAEELGINPSTAFDQIKRLQKQGRVKVVHVIRREVVDA